MAAYANLSISACRVPERAAPGALAFRGRRSVMWKSRKFAVGVMIVVIAGSILFGSHRSLSGLRRNVEDIFQNGVDHDGFSIAADLEKRDGIARNMTTIALHYYEADDSTLKAVEDARRELQNAVTPEEKCRADRALADSVSALYDLLSRTDLTEKDEKYPARLYDDFKSRGMTIQTNGYHQAAAEYNRVLDSFPANVLGKLTGVKPASLYQ